MLVMGYIRIPNGAVKSCGKREGERGQAVEAAMLAGSAQAPDQSDPVYVNSAQCACPD